MNTAEINGEEFSGAAPSGGIFAAGIAAASALATAATSTVYRGIKASITVTTAASVILNDQFNSIRSIVGSSQAVVTVTAIIKASLGASAIITADSSASAYVRRWIGIISSATATTTSSMRLAKDNLKLVASLAVATVVSMLAKLSIKADITQSANTASGSGIAYFMPGMSGAAAATTTATAISKISTSDPAGIEETFYVPDDPRTFTVAEGAPMKVGTYNKQPADVVDLDISFADWLAEGDALASHTATAATGLTLDSSLITNGNTVKLWISGGTSGSKYKIEINATTSGGRVKQVELYVKVKEI